ncbi:MAG: hypothetical protein HRT87_00580 [Legionellales bacterium]|nr:hypothetical protein [Legionellales bacterium]
MIKFINAIFAMALAISAAVTNAVIVVVDGGGKKIESDLYISGLKDDNIDISTSDEDTKVKTHVNNGDLRLRVYNTFNQLLQGELGKTYIDSIFDTKVIENYVVLRNLVTSGNINIDYALTILLGKNSCKNITWDKYITNLEAANVRNILLTHELPRQQARKLLNTTNSWAAFKIYPQFN